MESAARNRIAGIFAPGRAYSRPAPSSAYLRGPIGGPGLILGPNPPLRDARDDVRRSWVATASRAIDAMHNNGWVAGIVNTMVSLIVGDGLTPNFKPDMSAFGWNERQTAEWARMAERRFLAYANDEHSIDAGSRAILAQFQVAAVKSWFATGEAFVDFPLIRRYRGAYASKVRMLPSHWASQKTDDLARLFQGVYLDSHGATRGYLFEIGDRMNIKREIRKAARDNYGRIRVGHAFDGMGGQVRGITPLAPILRVLRDYDQLANATLTAAMIHAVFAATVESDYPTDGILAALKDEDEHLRGEADYQDAASRFDDFMAQKVGWHQNVDIDLGQRGKIAHLMTGERLNLHSAKHPNATYQAHANFLLREIARAAGAQFEDATGDYSGMTHATMKMATSKNWPTIMYRRKIIPGRISQWIAENWIEEAIDRGDLPLPGGIQAFVANKQSICRIDWRGPPKPVADELKAAKAHETYRNMGVMTDEAICADLGTDHEDVYEGRAREKATREELGIHGGITNGGTDADMLDEIAAGDQPAGAGNQG